MKIVCGSCQAKYSIADEKVAGKVFKIRCKRCGEVIVVRGDQEAAPEPAAGNGHAPANDAAAFDAPLPTDAIWHVVINGEQAGPYAPSQLAELIHAGQLDWEAYVWCEGFENWQPMRDVAELVAAISGQQQQQPEEQPVRPARVPTQPGTPSMGADPFADEAPAQVAMYAKPAQAVGQAAAVGGGVSSALSAHGATALSGTYDGGGSSSSAKVVASGPRVSTEQAMTGARNENSVLFSLKNLQALATGSSAPAAPMASQRPGYAGGEGSGLIDIRALATATGVNEQTKANSEKDALLSLGSAQAGAFGALGSPMLAPPGRIEDDGSKKSLMMAILGGFLILAGAGVAIAIIMKPSAAPPQAIAPVGPMAAPPSAAAPPANPAAPAAAAPSAAANNPAEPPSEGEKAANERAAMAAAKPSSENEESRHGHHGRGGKEGAPERSAEATPAPKAAAADSEAKPDAPPKKHSGSGSIDDLLNDAIGGGKGAKSGGSASAAASNLPEKPTRDDVLNAMNGVKGEVAACGKGQSGVAFANVTVIGKTGRVSNVEVTGMTGDVGSCIARTVRKAQFPKFKSDNFQVKFPFRM